ncbi:luciferase family oxidoreductase, group 1 [Filimonas lacunae]|uniref:Luciferase-like monooxygenase n=1 Tax=Filimonas lacunae TaxID=477680 RepID=A0A173MG69_9BACT|nr:LLM class flavin-dependent oxidoreductase [Filimonas lacunae]BAV06496.1 luciferase-like monooxygenase [Filimonas lacunae]SIT27171.1 luciferase family oxidoreductase, group 1 [Filimonas lacunae]
METNEKRKIAWSVLDLATVLEGKTAADSFANSLALAKHAESLDYTRFWLAEHHNMIGVASSATSILIGHIAGGTQTIRVGSGGIMLPNHAPLVVAEQFGTLASLYPGRIDLGLGRAPGTDQLTARALRGENFHAQHNFPADIQKLQRFFSAENSTASVRAIPGEGLDIPIWILGSSTDSALLAAAMGLPYAFASHFAPTYFMQAIELYRKNFQPSQWLQQPYVISCVNVVAADTDAEAERLTTSIKQFFMGVVTGKRSRLLPPVDSMEGIWDMQEEAAVMQMLAYSFVGGPQKLQAKIESFLQQTGVNEIMATAHIYDQTARLHSYTLFAQLMQQINA